jgi:hypothetical protein
MAPAALTVQSTRPARGDEASPRTRDAATGGRALRSDRATLSDEARREIKKLEERDRKVRAHEAAHQAAGGALAGGATFTYELGPDGRSYAVGGEVPVRAALAGSPDAALAAARQMRAAALAPGDPSAQDLAVASAASQAEQQALARKAQEAYGLHRAQGPSQGSGASAR